MKVVVIDRYGGNEVVEVREAPLPTPGPEEVLIRVRAASVNPVDWKIRKGEGSTYVFFEVEEARFKI